MLAGQEPISKAHIDQLVKDCRVQKRGFLSALKSCPHSVALIAEIKRGSPSKGNLRSVLDPEQCARIYESVGADCLSVLTDRDYFDARDGDIDRARAATQLPILRKDFIIDARQLFEPESKQADAVLLIARILSDRHMCELREIAEALGFDVLFEAHTLDEAERAIDCGAKMVGINNRDLDTFETRIDVSETIIPKIRDRVYCISESALESSDDVERVRQIGAKAVLIGTAFMAADDVGAKVQELMKR